MNAFWQHLLISGPVFGFVSAVFQHMLLPSAPTQPDPATHQIVRQTIDWHGHFLGNYYITPEQFFIAQCLAILTACWMIGLIVGLVVIGIKTEAARRRKCRTASLPRRTAILAASTVRYFHRPTPSSDGDALLPHSKA